MRVARCFDFCKISGWVIVSHNRTYRTSVGFMVLDVKQVMSGAISVKKARVPFSHD